MSKAMADSRPQTWLISGGAGFIGSNFIRSSLLVPGLEDGGDPGVRIVNYDKLTYAGRLENLADVAGSPHYRFVQGDITDSKAIGNLLADVRPNVVINLAAESHVDRSIDGPAVFVQTNIVGTFTLLEAARAYWTTLPNGEKERFRFIQVSTDEVYGSIGPDDPPVDETAPFAPSSPYSASKAGADHLVSAAHVTYGLPVIVTHASNNFGPYQFPEKFIPVIILNALDGKEIPIYGDGRNQRDWLSVHDHCDGLRLIAQHGQVGQHYNIAAHNLHRNIDLARAVCALIDELAPEGAPHADLIHFVADRPGHDRRYAVDAGKLRRELGWTVRADFSDALRQTVQWYMANRAWCDRLEQDGHERRRIGTLTAGESP